VPTFTTIFLYLFIVIKGNIN